MRVNVYNEELTSEVRIVTAAPETGKTFIGIQFVLKSAPELHHEEDDDDRSAVTLWFDSWEKAATLLDTARSVLAGSSIP